MRTTLLYFVFFILFGCPLMAQLPAYAEGRFSVEIPDGWQRKPKILVALNDILSTQIDLLKDKRFCFNCDAEYTVKFNVSQFQLLNKNAVSTGNNAFQGETYYSFKGSMAVFDTNDQLLTSLELVNPTAPQKIKYSMSYLARPGRSTTSYSLVNEANQNNPSLNNSGDILRRQGLPSNDDIMTIFEDRIKTVWSDMKKKRIL